MALHADFPYTAKQFYCKTCKQVTIHEWNARVFKCSKCGRVWTDELLTVKVKQNQYGKFQYECIVISDKPVNSTDYPSVTFDTLEQCMTWLREKTSELHREILGTNPP